MKVRACCLITLPATFHFIRNLAAHRNWAVIKSYQTHGIYECVSAKVLSAFHYGSDVKGEKLKKLCALPIKSTLRLELNQKLIPGNTLMPEF